MRLKSWGRAKEMGPGVGGRGTRRGNFSVPVGFKLHWESAPRLRKDSCVNPRYLKYFGSVLMLALGLAEGPRLYAQQAVGATFGTVIQLLGGTPSDVVLDELRNR